MNLKHLFSDIYLAASSKCLKQYPSFLLDDIIGKKLPVIVDDKVQFYFFDFGPIVRSRAKTITTKEPETISWINDMDAHSDCLFDIGANIGIFSLYAATRKIKTIAFEPQAMNFALLSNHIFLNALSEYITAYSVALGDRFCFSKLNMFEGSTWGTANSTFDRNIDSQGNLRDDFNKKQGAISVELDSFVDSTEIIPSHLKIDVDGNELLVLRGAISTLNNPKLKSILVELTSTHAEFDETLSLINSYGFRLDYVGSSRKNTSNHIFNR